MVSEIEVGICNFKWTKSVAMPKKHISGVYEETVDHRYAVICISNSGWSKWKRAAQSSIHKSPQIGDVSRLSIPLLNLLGCPDPGSPKQPGPWNHGLFFHLWHSPRSAYDAAFAGGPEVEETQVLDGGGVFFFPVGVKTIEKNLG